MAGLGRRQGFPLDFHPAAGTTSGPVKEAT